jgi:hypothetical protein
MQVKKLEAKRLSQCDDQEFVVLQQPILARTPRERQDEKKNESKVDFPVTIRVLGDTGGMSKIKRAELAISQLIQFSVNTAAGKYKQFLNGGVNYGWTQLANAAEFNSIDALFDEVFIRSVTMHYIPCNRHSANTTASTTAAGSPGFINTLAAVAYCLPHNAADYTDSSSTAQNALQAWHSKYVDLGIPFVLRVKNPEKFDWQGPLGDQSSSTSTMSWCQFSKVGSCYGGFFAIATPEASGASAGIGTLLEGGIWGHIKVTYDIAVRARA